MASILSVATAVALLVLGLSPAPARASWLSQALDNYAGDGYLDSYYYGPGYGYYPPAYSYYYAPGYEVVPGSSHHTGEEKRSAGRVARNRKQVLVIPARHLSLASDTGFRSVLSQQ